MRDRSARLELSAAPAERVRIHLPAAAYETVLQARLGELQPLRPKVELDVTLDDAFTDGFRRRPRK